MERMKLLKKLKKEAMLFHYVPLARLIGINYVSLWRITTGKSSGSIKNWDKIFKYYKQ